MPLLWGEGPSCTTLTCNLATSRQYLMSHGACRVPVPDQGAQVVWQGTTWQGCPFLCMWCAPLCCSQWHWTITNQRIDLTRARAVPLLSSLRHASVERDSSLHARLIPVVVCTADGCCGNDVDSISLRRVVDIHFHRNMLQLCLGRGTVLRSHQPINGSSCL